MNFLGALYPLTEVQRPTDLTKIFSATVRWLGSATYLPQESWKGLHFEAQTPCLGQIGSQYPILQRMRGDTPISLILHEVPRYPRRVRGPSVIRLFPCRRPSYQGVLPSYTSCKLLVSPQPRPRPWVSRSASPPASYLMR